MTIEHVYRAAGLVLAVVAVLNLRDPTNPKRYGTALFWGAYALTLLLGSTLPDVVNGLLVIVMVLIGGLRGLDRGDSTRTTTSPEQRLASATRFGNRLFLPALLIPVLTLTLALTMKHQPALIETKNLSLIALAVSAVVAMVVAVLLFRQPALAPAHEGRRMFDLIGWAAVIPQMLAVLGGLFAAAGVGDRLAELLGRVVPLESRLAVVLTYTVGMALFTVVMGNAYAAFPVMTAAVGLPLIVRRFGGDPTIMAALGMLSGFCGTLMTPMAANFNIVPAALLELPDKNGVIRAQVPTALMLLAANSLLMYFLVY